MSAGRYGAERAMNEGAGRWTGSCGKPVCAVEIKAEYIKSDFPAWTAIGVTALAFPGQRLEIKATALAR